MRQLLLLFVLAGGMLPAPAQTMLPAAGWCAADPHTYGRAGFPCFDNFTERCIFRFEIYTPASRPAYCNGYLLNVRK